MTGTGVVGSAHHSLSPTLPLSVMGSGDWSGDGCGGGGATHSPRPTSLVPVVDDDGRGVGGAGRGGGGRDGGDGGEGGGSGSDGSGGGDGRAREARRPPLLPTWVATPLSAIVRSRPGPRTTATPRDLNMACCDQPFVVFRAKPRISTWQVLHSFLAGIFRLGCR